MAASSRDILIRILTEGDSRGVNQVSGDIQKLADRAERAGKKMSLFLTAPLVGVGTLAFGGLLKRGVEFNRILQDSEVALGSLLGKFGGSEFEDLETRSRAAASGVEELKRQAKEAPGTIQDLVGGLTAIAGPGLAAGLRLEELIDLTVKLSQASSRLGLDQGQLVQESRALITGNVTLDASLAQALGVTNEMIRSAKEQGRLYQFLIEQLGPLAASADTATVNFSNLQDTIDQIAGKISKPVFEGLSEGALTVAEAIGQMDPSDLQDLATGIAGLIEKGVDLTKFFIEMEPATRKATIALLGLVALAGPITQLAGALGKVPAVARFAASSILMMGSNANVTKVALSGLGSTIALFAAAGAVGYGIGTAIDNLTGFSDAIGDAAKKAADAEINLEGALGKRLANLRAEARTMETASDLEAVRAKAIKDRATATEILNEARAEGDKETIARFEQQIAGIDRILGSLSQVLQLNQERVVAQDEINTAQEKTNELLAEEVQLHLDKVAITEDELDKMDRFQALFDLENQILKARADGDTKRADALQRQLDIEKQADAIRRRGFTEERGYDPVAMATERVSLERQVNSEIARRTGLLNQEAEAARQLKEGVRADNSFFNLKGERETRYFQNGRQIDESQAFDEPLPSSPAETPPVAQGQAPQPPQASQVDTSVIVDAINQIDFDDQGIIQALAGLERRINTRFGNIEGQILEIAN